MNQTLKRIRRIARKLDLISNNLRHESYSNELTDEQARVIYKLSHDIMEVSIRLMGDLKNRENE